MDSGSSFLGAISREWLIGMKDIFSRQSDRDLETLRLITLMLWGVMIASFVWVVVY